MPATTPPSEARFRPPFCPEPDCAFHEPSRRPEWRYESRGYREVARPPGRIRRFRCCACGRWFSSSTFREDYWKKLPGLTGDVFHRVAEGMGLRQAARTLRVSLRTVRHRVRWLGRQCSLKHLEMLDRLAGSLDEPVALDALRSFAGSLFEMVDVQTVVTTELGLMLGVDLAPLRRMGGMTPAQKAERSRRDERLGRQDPRARERATRDGLLRLVPLVKKGQPLQLVTDEDPAYARVVQELRGLLAIEHSTTSSRRRRDESNPLWMNNHLHRVMRHALRNLVRETIAHSKNLTGMIDRMLIFMIWRNFVKGRSERHALGSRETPAMLAGLAAAPENGASLFAERLFPGHFRLDGAARKAYSGVLRSRPGENVAADELRFAA